MYKSTLMKLTLLILMLISSPSHAIEIDEAMKASSQHLIAMNINLKNYKLISAQNMSIYEKKYIGPKSWFFTYQLRSLIPDNENSPRGKGGEIFVLFNGTTNEFRVTYGE